MTRKESILKRYLVLFMALAVTGVAVWSAPAADELTQFKVFIQEHPRALDELKKDPSLIGNPSFAAEHKVVGEYLAQHPNVKDQVKNELKKAPHFFDNMTATTKGGEHRAHPDGDGGKK
jgi:hypothetical protein